LSRCQYCNKLTHSEDLFVEYDISDQGKVVELASLIGWIPFYMYSGKNSSPEYGKLKCGDIYIHFIPKVNK
jgi:hypothetical protein